MKQQWQIYSTRFNALARRERGIVAAGLLLGLLLLGHTFLIEPQLLRYHAQTKNLASAAAEFQASEAQRIALQAQLKDPDAANRKSLSQVRGQLQTLESRLRLVENTLVPPGRMQAFIESLLSKNRSLELLALHTLAPTPLIGRGEGISQNRKADGAPSTPASKAAIVYKHGIEIKIAGSYNDLLMYVAELERMPERIIWNRNRLSTETYPRNEMTLTLYTLSTDKKWLTV